MEKEYATKDNVFWACFLALVVAIGFTSAVTIIIVFQQPTLTQLAEAEGAEWECVEKYSYWDETGWRCANNFLDCVEKRTKISIDLNENITGEYISNFCWEYMKPCLKINCTYALRRRD